MRLQLIFLLFPLLYGCASPAIETATMPRQLTHSPYPHVLTNINVFSPDGKWIAYDVRAEGGSQFDGNRIERVNVGTGEVDVLYTASHQAKVGVVTCHPTRDEVVFIHGPENPTPEFSYGAARRHGVIVDVLTRRASPLDARDLSAPFTPGALRGGTHVHVYSPDGRFVSSTYEDHVLESRAQDPQADRNQRTIAVTQCDKAVDVSHDHPQNHGGAFTAVVVATVNRPTPGSDQIDKAFEEGWIGSDGYLKPDGTRQHFALAFQGNVVSMEGQSISEVFVVDLPGDLTPPGDSPLEGTMTTRPAPPAGCVQRRLTYTTARRYPGIQGPRHWLRSSPDGSRIAFLMKDEAGIAQIWTVSPNGGPPTQLTHNAAPVASAFTWSADGRWIAHVMDNRVCVTDARTGRTHPLSEPADDAFAPKAQACVFSPDGRRIAYLAPDRMRPGVDQIWVIDFVPPVH